MARSFRNESASCIAALSIVASWDDEADDDELPFPDALEDKTVVPAAIVGD